MKVFVDTNVLLDVLAERKDFYEDSARLWTMAETGRIEACVSVVSFVTCYYVVRKCGGRSKAEKSVRLLKDVFAPIDLSAPVLGKAIDAGMPDFEDAVQFYSALQSRCTCLVTRNADHFPRSPIAVLSPSEFVVLGGPRPAKAS